jgi:hypothetical protein
VPIKMTPELVPIDIHVQLLLVVLLPWRTLYQKSLHWVQRNGNLTKSHILCDIWNVSVFVSLVIVFCIAHIIASAPEVIENLLMTCPA